LAKLPREARTTLKRCNSVPEPRPAQAAHGVTSISGGVINTTFSYDAKGNTISGNGVTVTYTSYNAPVTITRGTTSITFEHASISASAR
jgi:hypothetical protein